MQPGSSHQSHPAHRPQVARHPGGHSHERRHPLPEDERAHRRLAAAVHGRQVLCTAGRWAGRGRGVAHGLACPAAACPVLPVPSRSPAPPCTFRGPTCIWFAVGTAHCRSSTNEKTGSRGAHQPRAWLPSTTTAPSSGSSTKRMSSSRAQGRQPPRSRPPGPGPCGWMGRGRGRQAAGEAASAVTEGACRLTSRRNTTIRPRSTQMHSRPPSRPPAT